MQEREKGKNGAPERLTVNSRNPYLAVNDGRHCKKNISSVFILHR